jgi:hypothetical protein
MKKLKLIPAGLLLVAFVMIAGCKGSSSGGGTVTPVEKTIAELLPTVWIANVITEGGTVVYDKSKTTQTKDGYKNFKLDLSTAGKVTYTEYDGNTFTGTYAFSGTTLTLSALTPEPTGTGGTIAFTVTKKSDTNLEFARTSASTKTGGTNNVYNLIK